MQERSFTEKKFVTNNKKKVINILYLITFLISITFIDYYLLPKTSANDTIDYYIENVGKNRNGRSKNIVSYNYYTKKRNSFSTKNFLVEEDAIEIEYTLLLKSVTAVKSKDADYTKYLINGLNPNGIELYCCFVILISVALSLKILLSKKAVSENTFYNIICFNGFLLFVTFYMMSLF
ncbi:hypothetical protein [Flavobacterium panacagri]|uniref:hypothetical protein n=1 Tax=Flavobacterium panacagri TaxID=3034146 RepID=UPI0025A5E9AA|nr:hypothetical protein [Flavobacterium panacagri]